MKKIEKLRETYKGKKVAFKIKGDDAIIHSAVNFFNVDYFAEHTVEIVKSSRESVVVFDFECGLGYASESWYRKNKYQVYSIPESFFTDEYEEEIELEKEPLIIERTLIIVTDDHIVTNAKTDDIYFSDEECNGFFEHAVNPFDYIAVPTYGKDFERKPHVSVY